MGRRGNSKQEIIAGLVPVGTPASMLPTNGSDRKSKTSIFGSRPEPESIGKVLQRRAGYGKVDEKSIAKFLEAYRQCGIKIRAALAANLSYASIRLLEKNDPEFADLAEAAKQEWIANTIDDAIKKFGIDGVPKKMLNQKTGEVVEGELQIESQLTLAFARKFDSAYRERQEVDVNVQGGVMVVHAPAQSPAEWKERFSKRVVVDEPQIGGRVEAEQPKGG